MKLIKILIAVVVLFTSYTMNGQVLPLNEEKPFIEVTGTASLEIAPNEIYVDIIIEERYDGKEKLPVDMQEQKLKAVLEGLHVDLKNLSLSAANAEYVNVKKVGKDVLTKKNFKLKLTDALTVGKLFEQLDKIDLDNAYISMMNHSKMDSLKREIRIKAIKAAKEKADYLLAAIDAKRGQPLLVQEKDYVVIDPYTLNSRARTAHVENELYKDDGVIIKVKENVQLKMLKVESAIFVKFAIK
ncbi:MAG: SIMPL domain-containing protein [Taibaiella sp.]|jgi:hypothetical protein